MGQFPCMQRAVIYRFMSWNAFRNIKTRLESKWLVNLDPSHHWDYLLRSRDNWLFWYNSHESLNSTVMRNFDWRSSYTYFSTASFVKVLTLKSLGRQFQTTFHLGELPSYSNQWSYLLTRKAFRVPLKCIKNTRIPRQHMVFFNDCYH